MRGDTRICRTESVVPPSWKTPQQRGIFGTESALLADWRQLFGGIPGIASSAVRVQQMLPHSVMLPATCIPTSLEKRRPLPGDALVPEPIFVSTHAITIDAPPERVWRWIAQMGAGRAGWYSWDAIDNGGAPSATGIMPALQTVASGDMMPAVPGATDAFVVAAVDPPGISCSLFRTGAAEAPWHGNTFLTRCQAAERGSSCEDARRRTGSTSLVRRRLPLISASSSNVRTRCCRGFRVRCSSASPRSATASWRRGICAVFSVAALLRRHDA